MDALVDGEVLLDGRRVADRAPLLVEGRILDVVRSVAAP